MRFWVQVEALFGVNVIISRKRDNKRDNNLFLTFGFCRGTISCALFLCHCEEQSDVAISFVILRFLYCRGGACLRPFPDFVIPLLNAFAFKCGEHYNEVENSIIYYRELKCMKLIFKIKN